MIAERNRTHTFIRSTLFFLAAVGLFAFPWPYAAALVFAFALYVPPAAFVFGLLADALYYTSEVGLPLATMYGACASVIAFFMNRFIRSRISDISFD